MIVQTIVYWKVWFPLFYDDNWLVYDGKTMLHTQRKILFTQHRALSKSRCNLEPYRKFDISRRYKLKKPVEWPKNDSQDSNLLKKPESYGF